MQLLTFFQGQNTPEHISFVAELGTPLYWAVVILGTLVFFLAAAVIFYLIRDARHRGREEILQEVRTQHNQALWLEFHHTKRQAEAMEAAQMAEAAKRSEVLALPLMVGNNSVQEERKELESFGAQYPPDLNPFLRGSRTTSFMAPAPQQQQQQQQQQ